MRLFAVLLLESRSTLSFLVPPDGGRHVSVPLHEALHGRGDVPPAPGLLPPASQQLLRLLRPVPAARCLARPRTQRLRHLFRGLRSHEQLLRPLPCPAQVPRVPADVLVTLLSMLCPPSHTGCCWAAVCVCVCFCVCDSVIPQMYHSAPQ